MIPSGASEAETENMADSGRQDARWGASAEEATQFRRTASTLYAIARYRNENNNDHDKDYDETGYRR